MLRLGIIGDPLSHTLSPVLHRFLLEQSGIAGEYRAYETPADRLGERIASFKTEGFRGFNVTIPHKVRILDTLDSVSPEALIVQAVNTVVMEAGRLHGENTDIIGFLKGMPTPVRSTLPDRNGLVLGGGGAARAVLAGLLQENIRTLTLRVRSLERARGLMDLIPALKDLYGATTEVQIQPWGDVLDYARFELVVNTTPLGMSTTGPAEATSPLSDLELARLPQTALVYDLVYRPRTTPLLAKSLAHGLTTEDGLKMLVYQGTAAFTLWTGREVSDAVAETALMQLDCITTAKGSHPDLI